MKRVIASRCVLVSQARPSRKERVWLVRLGVCVCVCERERERGREREDTYDSGQCNCKAPDPHLQIFLISKPETASNNVEHGKQRVRH